MDVKSKCFEPEIDVVYIQDYLYRICESEFVVRGKKKKNIAYIFYPERIRRSRIVSEN